LEGKEHIFGSAAYVTMVQLEWYVFVTFFLGGEAGVQRTNAQPHLLWLRYTCAC